MKHYVKILAASAVAASMASASLAATFDFTFAEERGGGDVVSIETSSNIVGEGTLSFDGAISAGVYNLEALTNLQYSFAFGDTVLTQDAFVMTPVQSQLRIFNVGGGRMGAFFTGVRPVSDIRFYGGCRDRLPSLYLQSISACLSTSLRREDASFQFIEFGGDNPFPGDGGILRAPVAYSGVYIGLTSPVAAVPLPASVSLMALALGGLGFARRRKS